jgi:hypothetical protein
MQVVYGRKTSDRVTMPSDSTYFTWSNSGAGATSIIANAQETDLLFYSKTLSYHTDNQLNDGTGSGIDFPYFFYKVGQTNLVIVTACRNLVGEKRAEYAWVLMRQDIDEFNKYPTFTSVEKSLLKPRSNENIYQDLAILGISKASIGFVRHIRCSYDTPSPIPAAAVDVAISQSTNTVTVTWGAGTLATSEVISAYEVELSNNGKTIYATCGIVTTATCSNIVDDLVKEGFTGMKVMTAKVRTRNTVERWGPWSVVNTLEFTLKTYAG